MSALAIAAAIFLGSVFIWLILKGIVQIRNDRINEQRLMLKRMEVETEALAAERRNKEAEVELDRSLYNKEAIAKLRQKTEEREKTIVNLRQKMEDRNRAAGTGAKDGDVSTEESLPRGTETLLLVESESLSRDVGQVILEHLGYTVLSAKDGDEALDVYRAHRDEIALVLTDMVMAKMAGENLCEALVRISPEEKVVLVSGKSIQKSEEDLRGSGFKGFVQKPYQPIDLAQVVRQTLDE